MSMGKPTGSESWCLQVQVQYLIWHTHAYPWTCAMVSWVHHRYIMGSDLSVSTALFTLMAHGPQGDFLSPRIFSLHSSSNSSLLIFFMAFSFIDDLIFMGEITSSSNYLCCLNADHFFLEFYHSILAHGKYFSP